MPKTLARENLTTRERKLIDSVLNAPSHVQQNLSETLTAINQHNPRGQFLEYLIKLVVKASKKAQIPPDTASETTYFTEMVKILTKPEILKEFAPSADPLISARLRGQQVKIQLLYQGDSPLSSEQVGALLHITRQAVDKRRNQGKLLGLSLGRRGYLYPSWQFKEGKLLAGLDRVLTALKEYDAWTKLMFFKTGDIRLEGKTPLECLEAGEIEAVIRAAECYGKHTAALEAVCKLM